MAAATRTASTANAQSLVAQLQREKREDTGFQWLPEGFYVFERVVSLLTTNLDDANDEVYLALMPLNTYLVHLQVTMTDVDTHATPTLVFDINTDDGSTEVTLIDGSTIGQGGGSDELDANGGHYLRDISGKYIALKVATGTATGAAGTITLKMMVWRGTLPTETSTD